MFVAGRVPFIGLDCSKLPIQLPGAQLGLWARLVLGYFLAMVLVHGLRLAQICRPNWLNVNPGLLNPLLIDRGVSPFRGDSSLLEGTPPNNGTALYISDDFGCPKSRLNKEAVRHDKWERAKMGGTRSAGWTGTMPCKLQLAG